MIQRIPSSRAAGIAGGVAALVAWVGAAAGMAGAVHADTRVGASFLAMTLSNTLLAASTSLYVANLAFGSRGVGRLATLLAAGGAFGIAGALAMRGVELGALSAPRFPSRSYLYEATALFAAVSVFIYLAMECLFRNRTAGAFVMPVIMAAVACELWLIWDGPIAAAEGLAGIQHYWRQSWTFASVISEAALLAAAAIGVLYLVRLRLDGRSGKGCVALNALPGAWRAFDLIVTSVAVGFPLYLLAACIGLVAVWNDPRPLLSGGLAGTAAVLAIYGWFFYVVYRARATGTHVAICAIAGCLASLSLTLGYGPFAPVPGAL